MNSHEPMILLLAGLPGPMATEVALAAAESGIPIMEQGLAGRTHPESWQGVPGMAIRLLGPEDRDSLVCNPGTVAVDFTTPQAALDNIRWYVQRRVPFVLGTTGFDGTGVRSLVESGTVPAVVAPNMAIPIILLQSAIRHVADRYPGALAGYELRVEESHQSTKRDPSGTARGLEPHWSALGLQPADGDLVSHRDPIHQEQVLGVPPEHLKGHAWHWYRAQSREGSVSLELSHRINGRRVYADGALAAARYIWLQSQKSDRGRLYTMLDVLEGLAR